MSKHRGGRIKNGRLAAKIFDEQRVNGINADRNKGGDDLMKFTRNAVSFGQNARNTSAPAPGANGPGPLPAASAAVQDGRVAVQTSPGDPNFGAEMTAKQQHPKSKQVPTHPAHNDRAMRGARSDGSVVLEAGAAAGSCNDWAGE
jgi:hypothetical protein